jgi:myosin-18
LLNSSAFTSILLYFFRKDQSIIFIGRSGSGKTTNLKHVMTCLAQTAAASRPNAKKPVTSPLTSEKVNAIFVLLEAFGNSRTVMNANATR